MSMLAGMNMYLYILAGVIKGDAAQLYLLAICSNDYLFVFEDSGIDRIGYIVFSGRMPEGIVSLTGVAPLKYLQTTKNSKI
ncbi:hypothetical protein L6773_17895 [Rhodohalobacter sp. WB101]|uniref:Uncharacterized protein n=1 Tax=Rhodohalobacter sulfatireducens TaxID=2911366 RepID=A0ABS9KHX0_9BACT|nr:hypothetical protein [Rhodohalobacter sulfatireducens]